MQHGLQHNTFRTTLNELAGWEKPKNSNTPHKNAKAILEPQVRARKQLAFAPDSSANVTSLRYFQHNELLPNGKLKSESGPVIYAA